MLKARGGEVVVSRVILLPNTFRLVHIKEEHATDSVHEGFRQGLAGVTVGGGLEKLSQGRNFFF